MKEIKGDLIALAKDGVFDVIAHGVNCMCRQKSGLAPQMVKHFQTNEVNVFRLESEKYKGDINKLGQIDYGLTDNINTTRYGIWFYDHEKLRKWHREEGGLFVVNAYTQYEPGVNNLYPENKIPLDYNALKMCFTKMNYLFEGLHIGLPHIGCGLAGGDINKVKELINQYFTKCDVTIVTYEKGT